MRGLLARVLGVLVVAGMVAACAADSADICGAKCACEGCKAGEESKCVDEFAADSAAADYRGCPFAYVDLIDCYDGTGTCVNGDWKTSCGPEKDTLKRCIAP